MPNNTRLKYNLNTIQNFQHVVRIEAFTKQILKKYLESELNCKKFQRTYATCLVYHLHGQAIIQITNLNKNAQKFEKVQNWVENNDMHIPNFRKT